MRETNFSWWFWSQNSNFCIREGTLTTKRKKKVANNDFTGKKKYLWGGSLASFFLRSFCEKKRKSLEKKQGLWEIRSFISCQSRGWGKIIVNLVHFLFVPFILILHSTYPIWNGEVRFFFICIGRALVQTLQVKKLYNCRNFMK